MDNNAGLYTRFQNRNIPNSSNSRFTMHGRRPSTESSQEVIVGTVSIIAAKKRLSEILPPSNFNIYTDRSSFSNNFLAPPGIEILREARLDCIQKQSVSDSISKYHLNANECSGTLLVTDIRLIFLPHCCREEKLLRYNWERIVGESGTITIEELSSFYSIERIAKSRLEKKQKRYGRRYDGPVTDNASRFHTAASSVPQDQNRNNTSVVDGNKEINFRNFLSLMASDIIEEEALQRCTVQILIGSIASIEISQIRDGEQVPFVEPITFEITKNIDVSIPTYEEVKAVEGSSAEYQVYQIVISCSGLREDMEHGESSLNWQVGPRSTTLLRVLIKTPNHSGGATLQRLRESAQCTEIEIRVQSASP